MISGFSSFPMLTRPVAQVLQNPSDARMFSSSSTHGRKSHDGAAGESGFQAVEVLDASHAWCGSSWLPYALCSVVPEHPSFSRS